jgi:HSP20 family protein
MLMRFDPFRELETVAQTLGRASRPSTMPMDAYRSGDRFVINVDLPGVDPNSIEVTVERNVLSIRAERNWQPSNGQEVLVAERPQGTFTRQFFLGDSLDTDRIEASYENGVLTLSIPVAEQAKPRKVAVGSTNSGSSASRQAIPAEATAR